MDQAKTVAFHTLGCKLNFSESSSLARRLQDEGFRRKDFDQHADVYVINTCSVTENADRECRQLVRRIQRRFPQSLVVITGCYAQLKPQEIAAISGVDLVLGAAEKFNLVQHIRELTKGYPAKICSCDIDDVSDFVSSCSVHDRTRAFLKVQDGCDYNCSFCTIPLARGKSRSDSIDHVIKNARYLAGNGIKEIILTGVNLGDFHSGRSGMAPSKNLNKENFFSLLCELEKVEGIRRYRISSIEPNLLTDEIIEFVAHSKRFMPHFHIPLQSGSNRILGLMRRRYKKELYADRVKLIKTLMPQCAIGADVIVGFPSETENDFNETFELLQSLDLSYLHVFTYSERDDTHALSIQPVVPISTRHQRNKILRNLSFMKTQYFVQQHRGQYRKVLFESEGKNGMIQGYTDNYIKISAPYKPGWANEIVDWKI